jgi:hypothetical protein
MPLLVVMFACGDSHVQPDARDIDGNVPVDVGIDSDPNNPPTLMDTGLCLDAACTQIAPGIKAYTPQFELYSDGATKKRWIYLPPGTQIDTSNMDFWQFPVGTKLWKEFTRDGVRVETRLVMRIAAETTTGSDWFYVTYVWNQAQNATTAETFGVPDANGTQHDVPNRTQCKTCHDNTQPSRVLGFSAIQLDRDNPSDEYDLRSLVDANLLTNPPTNSGSVGAYFPLPGNTTVEQPVLGYLHANCGHCHNPNSKIYIDNGIMMQLRLTVGTLGSLSTTPAYATAVNANGKPINGLTKIVVPMQPDQSIMVYRFQTTNPAEKMPALGTEILDTAGQTLLRTWITNLQ